MADEILSRADAKARGLTRYHGAACRHGHGTERLVSNGNCIVCGREKVKAAYAARKAALPPKPETVSVNRLAAEARMLGERFFTTGAPCPAGHMAPRYASSRSCVVCEYEEFKARREANRAHYNALNRKYKESPEAKERFRLSRLKYREENLERERKQQKRWVAENRDVKRANIALRKTMLLQACPSWVDLEAIVAVYRQARELSEVTGIPHHVDHIVPLKGKTVCGLHVHWNLRAIPAVDNLRKRNFLIDAETNQDLSNG